MTDYTKLVKALRSASTVSTAWEKLMHDAAAAIEELIESVHIRDKILDELNHYIWKLEAEVKRLNMRCADCEYAASEWPEDPEHTKTPKRGEWQKAKPKGVVTYSDGYAECSHCHETIWLGWWMNFCPHCGTQNKIIDPDDYDWVKMEVQDGDD